jgi:tetratricopeptide (TPR) repeat protein
VTIAVAALVLAVPAALFALWPLLARREEPPGTAPDDERAALEADKVAALRVLRELDFEHQAGHMAEADYAELRARYEGRASRILTRLDALAPPSPAGRPAAAAPRTPWTRQPVALGIAGVGLLAFGVVVGVLVTRFTAPAPPETMDPMGPAAAAPGRVGPLGPAAGAPEAAEAPGAGGASQPLPAPVLEGMLRAAHASLDAGHYQEAITAYKAVLKREPTNVDAITHLGVILARAGHADAALEAFDRALAIDPDYIHALWDKAGLLYDQKQDYAGAVAVWERFVRLAPAGPDRDQASVRIREARARLAAVKGGTKP